MTGKLGLVFLLLVLPIGCSQGNAQAPSRANAAKIKEQAESRSKEWANMGMWLPNAQEVAFFSTNLAITKDVLAERLRDPNDDVRQRAAYVIEQIGPPALPLGSALVKSLAKEKVPLVRIYLCNALRAIGGGNEDSLTQLRTLFHASANDKDTLDQRIYAAAALSSLSKNPKEVSECTDFVCQWLKPPDKDLSSSELEKYWDLRWSAVNAVEHMTQAREAIPLLENMLTEPDKRSWVDVHVPRALAALKGTPASQAPPPAQDKWTPPKNPDPQKILSEAQGDMIAGRYENSLSKLVWFYKNSLKIDPALYGVRLSFALSYWKQLANVYPPAKTKLIEFRDEAERKVKNGENVHASFHDFTSINSQLGDNKRTAELFKSLDKKNPKVAAQVFDIAQPALIREGEIKLCSRFVDPKKDYPRLVQLYHENMRIAGQSKFSDMQKDFAQKSFSNGVATLVALLVVSDRKADGKRIATEAKTVLADKEFAAALDQALKGKVPEPWP